MKRSLQVQTEGNLASLILANTEYWDYIQLNRCFNPLENSQHQLISVAYDLFWTYQPSELCILDDRNNDTI